MNGLTLIKQTLRREKVKGPLYHHQIEEFVHFRDIVRRNPKKYRYESVGDGNRIIVRIEPAGNK